MASSTSSLTWPEPFGDLPDGGRWLAAYPFDPPHLVPLVEINGPDKDTVGRAADLYRSLGKFPVTLKTPAVGHIANRLASALWREAVDMVAKGIADPEDIDGALVQRPRIAVVGHGSPHGLSPRRRRGRHTPSQPGAAHDTGLTCRAWSS